MSRDVDLSDQPLSLTSPSMIHTLPVRAVSSALQGGQQPSRDAERWAMIVTVDEAIHRVDTVASKAGARSSPPSSTKTLPLSPGNTPPPAVVTQLMRNAGNRAVTSYLHRDKTKLAPAGASALWVALMGKTQTEVPA